MPDIETLIAEAVAIIVLAVAALHSIRMKRGILVVAIASAGRVAIAILVEPLIDPAIAIVILLVAGLDSVTWFYRRAARCLPIAAIDHASLADTGHAGVAWSIAGGAFALFCIKTETRRAVFGAAETRRGTLRKEPGCAEKCRGR